MALGWKSRDAAAGRVGVAIDAGGFALVHVVETGGKPVLEVCEYVHCEGDDELALALSGAVKEHRLGGTPATAVLAADAYVMRTIDAPDVPSEELREASRWAMRDLLDFDPAEAVVDVMPIPATSTDSTRRLFAVAAREEQVERAVELVREAGLDPKAAEIRETSLLNLAPLIGDASEGQAFLRLSPKRSRFGVVRDGALCMARDLVTDLSELESDPDAVEPHLENVLLEVQRSLDYFESNFGRVPAQRLWVLPSQYELGGIVHFLAENATLPVDALDLELVVDTPLFLPQALQDRTLAALSAAVRPPDVSNFELWNPALAAPVQPLSAPALVKAAGVFVAGLLALSFAGEWQIGRTEATLARVEAQLEAEGSRVAIAEARAGRGPDARIAGEIAALRTSRARKSQVLDALSGGSLGNLEGFSPVLEALARRRTDAVWLERIEIRQGGRAMALAGGASAPEAVPGWMAGLRGEPFLDSKSFQAFELGPPAAGAQGITFSLDSDRVSEDAS